jgi:hypothetical protein
VKNIKSESMKNVSKSAEWIQIFLVKSLKQPNLLSMSDRLKILGDLAFTQLFLTFGTNDMLSNTIEKIDIIRQLTMEQLLFLASQNKVNPSTSYLLSYLSGASSYAGSNLEARMSNVVDSRIINRHDYTINEQMEYVSFRFLCSKNCQQQLNTLFVKALDHSHIMSYTTRFQGYGLTHRIFYLSRLNRISLDTVLTEVELNQARYQTGFVLWKSLLESDLDLSIELLICHILLSTNVDISDLKQYFYIIEDLYGRYIVSEISKSLSISRGFKIYHTILAYSILRRLTNAANIKNYE